MEKLQHFEGVLPRGFRGNVTYNFRLPEGLSAIAVTLLSDSKKERIPSKEDYFENYGQELTSVLSSYLEREASKEEVLEAMDGMKTEIQLCLMIDDQFAGNVHMPGSVKELLISAEEATRGCIPCKNLSGMAKVIVNAFYVIEEETAYQLEVKGEFCDVEAN